MTVSDMDFSTNYCVVCDFAHEKGGLYCSTKCKKRDAKECAPSKASLETMAALIEQSKSSHSIYASSNLSTSSLNLTAKSRDSAEASRDTTRTRPPLDRSLSHQRPLPPTKRNSYSTSMSRSVELVTPIMTPLSTRGMSNGYMNPLQVTDKHEAVKAEKVSPGFLYPIQAAGSRFNHNDSSSGQGSDNQNEPRRMFFFKRVQSQDDVVDRNGNNE